MCQGFAKFRVHASGMMGSPSALDQQSDPCPTLARTGRQQCTTECRPAPHRSIPAVVDPAGIRCAPARRRRCFQRNHPKTDLPSSFSASGVIHDKLDVASPRRLDGRLQQPPVPTGQDADGQSRPHQLAAPLEDHQVWRREAFPETKCLHARRHKCSSHAPGSLIDRALGASRPNGIRSDIPDIRTQHQTRAKNGFVEWRACMTDRLYVTGSCRGLPDCQ